jgi:hypothetical protein
MQASIAPVAITLKNIVNVFGRHLIELIEYWL